MMLGSFCHHVGIIFGSVWHEFEIILGSLWDEFGIILGSFWDEFGIISGSVWDEFGVILGSFPLIFLPPGAKKLYQNDGKGLHDKVPNYPHPIPSLGP